MPRFQQNIVLDLEFTHVDRDNGAPGFFFEVIQIGAVRVLPDGRIADTFSCFVKPQFASRISYKVQQLTGIHQWNVCDQPVMEEALEAFRAWVGDAPTRYVTWSMSDLAQLRGETAFKQIPFPEDEACWLDLQKVYPRVMRVGSRRSMALKDAVDWYGVAPCEESLHGAPYDAWLTAELLASLLSGEYHEHKRRLASVMAKSSRSSETSFNVGQKCSGLLELKARLEAQAQQA